MSAWRELFWPSYCCECGKGYEPDGLQHFCSACLKAWKDEEKEES